MPTPVPPPYRVRQLFVCTHTRDPASGKASCGANGSVALRETLKHAVKARGLKRQVLVTQSGCLDVCPASGCAVAFYPENTWYIADPGEADQLLAQLIEGTSPPETTG